MDIVSLTRARRLLRLSKVADSLITHAAFVLAPVGLVHAGLYFAGIATLAQSGQIDARTILWELAYSATMWGVIGLPILYLLLAWGVRFLSRLAFFLIVTGVIAAQWAPHDILNHATSSLQGDATVWGALVLLYVLLIWLMFAAVLAPKRDRVNGRRRDRANPFYHFSLAFDAVPGLRRTWWASLGSWPLFLLARACAGLASAIIAGSLGAALFDAVSSIASLIGGVSLAQVALDLGATTIFSLAGIVLFSLTSGAILYWIGGFLERQGRRIAVAGRRRAAQDNRPYILLLRSFNEGAIALTAFSRGPFGDFADLVYRSITFTRRGMALDPLLIEEFSGVGPIVALGDPSGDQTTFGAERVFASNDEWQAEVIRLAQGAAHIVLVLGATPGTLWEVALVAQPELAAKTLLLATPGKGDLLLDDEFKSRFDVAAIQSRIDARDNVIAVRLPHGDAPGVAYTVRRSDGDGYQTALQAFFRRKRLGART